MRAAWPIQEQLHKHVADFFGRIIDKDACVNVAEGGKDDAWQAVANTYHPVLFALRPGGSPYAQAEKCHLPSARMHMQGTRLVIATSEAAMYKYFAARHIGVKSTFSDLWKAFLSLDRKALQEYSKDAHLYFYTLSAGDVLITPAAWIIAELVQGQEVCCGLRQSFLLWRDQAGVNALKSVRQQLASDSTTQNSVAVKVIEKLEVGSWLEANNTSGTNQSGDGLHLCPL